MIYEKQPSRPLKLTHGQTILYEIDMLRLAKNRLHSPASKFPSYQDKWIYLEAFLLHYRNLLEFFSGRAGRNTDLSIARPAQIWGGQIPDNNAIAQLRKPELYQKYDSPQNDVSISKYLHHCTSYRIIAKDWNVAEMFEELRPVLEKFESLLPHNELNTPWRAPLHSQAGGTIASSTFSTSIEPLTKDDSGL
jgi:hypothetical protein